MSPDQHQSPREAPLPSPVDLPYPQSPIGLADDDVDRGQAVIDLLNGNFDPLVDCDQATTVGQGTATINSGYDPIPNSDVLARYALVSVGSADSSKRFDTLDDQDEARHYSLKSRGLRESLVSTGIDHLALDDLPNELLLHILGFLDVCDLLATSRTSHHLRSISLAPILHQYRLRRTRIILPPLLSSPSRPSLADLIHRSIFLTHTTVVSRRLGRSLAAIRLSHRLAARPPASALVERCVLPAECAPGTGHVAPALVAKKRAVEKERVKDGLRRWVDAVWRGEVRERGEGVRKWEERVGVGRVWRLRKFWERVGGSV